MDGFYVAKFKVEKRTKLTTAQDIDVNSESISMIIDEANKNIEEDVGFDSEEDRPILEDAKRRRMKAKGLRPPPRSKSMASTKLQVWNR